jgi:DNA-directed RNA polymerase specialized sigma subunit
MEKGEVRGKSAWKVAIKNQGIIKHYLEKNRWLLDKSHTLEWEDYWQIGLIALYQAALKHDPTKTKFSTYAMTALKWNLIRAFKTQAFPVLRVPEDKHPKGYDQEIMTKEERFALIALAEKQPLDEQIPEIKENSDNSSGLFVFFN